ncbi:MAG: DNA mismatch repair endonuclease MutL [Armatimonadota bacterium]
MPTIRILPENLANRIAAGEVVERPASIVKELVENAIDAGATRIEVELLEGGRRLIRVSDNGCGMTATDLQMAVQRFATSKIAEPEDLDQILTMGFRGEALPSIGAVAHLRLTSRQHDVAEGATLTVEGGALAPPEPVGCPPGTTVEVANLFFNTPARLKFLATTATERGHCLSWVQYLAMSRPDIAFKVIHEGQVVFTAPGGGDLQAVLGAVYGGVAAREFLPVQGDNGELQISGFISGPRLTRATRQHQFYFVNRRFVRSRQLSHALSEAYGMLLGAGKSPVCAIHFTLSPEEVDPNVHPTKIEVRFRTPARVHQAFQRACEEALAAAGFRSLSHRSVSGAGFSPTSAGVYGGPSDDRRLLAERLRVNPFADIVDARDDGLEVFTPPPLGDQATEQGHQQRLLDEPPAEAAPEVLGQLGGKYIIARIGRDLLLIDQHRAAERVVLHGLETQGQQVTRQLLAVPLTLELSPPEAAAVEQHTATLLELGFELEPFGPSAYLLRSVPAALSGTYELAVRDLVEDLAAWEVPAAEDKRQRQLLAMIACHSAIKKGSTISTKEMQDLVRDLLATDTPAVCPHGDPIIISMTGEQLDRRFRR